MITLILSVALVLALLLTATVGTGRTRRVLATFAAVPANRIRFYRRLIATGWIRAALAMLVTSTAGLSLTDIGVSGPGGGPIGGAPDGWGLTWVLAVVMSLSAGVGSLRVRRRMRAGQLHRQRAKIAALIPRTARERRYAAGLALTAGITEEVLFRGALIVLGIEVFHLPLAASAALSLILFAILHAYQGLAGSLGAGLLGLWFTGMTLLAGSVLPAMVLHVAIDLWALLVVPAEPTPRVIEADRPAEPAPHVTEVDRPAEPTTRIIEADRPTVPAIRPPAPAA